MGVKPLPNIVDASKIEKGEVDTSAPFQSVKAAVNMFGEGAFSTKKYTEKNSKPRNAEVFLLLSSN